MNVDVGGSPPSPFRSADPVSALTSFFSPFLQPRTAQFAALPLRASDSATPSTSSSASTSSGPSAALSATLFSASPTGPNEPSSSASPSMSSGGFGGSGSGSGIGGMGGRPPGSSPSMPRPAFTPETTPVPEKCFSFCSQRAEDSPMCRMFCLRMRQPLPTQKEVLARLNGAGHDERVYGTRPVAEQEAATAGVFERMQRALAPYSIIVVKGTTEGIAGRYMEELERDDGNYDFGPMSRNAPDQLRRNGPQGVYWQSWGPAGYMLYLPLTSIFWPIIALPDNVERVFGPPIRLLKKVGDMVSNGVQLDLARDVGERMVDGRGLAFGYEVRDYVLKKAAEYRALQEKRWQMREERARQADPRYRHDPYLEQRVAEVKASEEAARVAKMGKGKENEK